MITWYRLLGFLFLANLSLAFNLGDVFGDGNNSTSIDELTCENVFMIPREEQCSFVQLKCADEEYQLGSIDIIQFYYCSSTHSSVRNLILLPIILFCLVLIFITLGFTASNFLCPNLSNISSFFNIPDNISGLTLLAFGNGSPDILGTYTSFNSGNTSLAIGELIGAGFFITCFIIGVMAILHPFQLISPSNSDDFEDEDLIHAQERNDKLVYVRDLVFFIASVAILVFILKDGKLTILKCLSMCMIYMLYVFVILLWNYVFNVRQSKVINNNRIRSIYNDDSVLNLFESNDNNDNSNNYDDGYEILDEPSNRRNSFSRFQSNNRPLRNSILDSMEFSSLLSNLQSRQSLPSYFLKDQRKMRINLASFSSYHDELGENANQVDSRSYESLHRSFHDDEEVEEDEEAEGEEEEHHFYDNFTREYLQSQSQRVEEQISKVKEIKNIDFKKLSIKITQNVIIYSTYPIQFFLLSTIPVRTQENMEEQNYLKLNFNQLCLLFTQLMIFPILFAIAFLRDSSKTVFIIIPLIFQVTCFLFFYFAYKTLTASNVSNSSSFERVKLINILLSFLGFAASISWISILAQELINVLKFISVLSRLSDAILGLTIFAMGNSIGDLISNVTMAKMGYPLMALAACFGGPLLNLLLGIGMNGLLVSNGSFLEFHLSPTLYISCLCLLLNLCFLVCYVPINGWKFDRPTGFIMIGIWCACTTINVIIELLS